METKILAGELLELEKIHASGGLSDSQNAQWRGLVLTLLKDICPAAEKRSDLRFDATGTVDLEIGGKHVTAQLKDVSKTGLSFSVAPGLLASDDTPVLKVINYGGESLSLACESRVARTDSDREEVAVVVSDDEAKKVIFDKIYYPLYIKYLHELT